MKKQVFYIHGGEAYSSKEKFLNYLRTVEISDPTHEQQRPLRWSARLREDLGNDFQVFTPTMPNKHDSCYEEWKIWFERHFQWLRDGVILVGWSQGGQFLVQYLIENSMPFRPKALCLVAAPIENFEFYGTGEDGGDFGFEESRLREIASKVDQIHFFHSTDDFVVPFSHAERYQAALPEATLHTFTDKNHFLVPELPELVQLIKTVA